MTYVTCPTMRYHPAVVAQKAATLQLLSEGRFTLGWAAGRTSTSTSSATAGPASRPATRCSPRRSRSSGRCTGDLVTYRGDHFDVDSARIWDLPEIPVELAMAVEGDRAIGRLRPRWPTIWSRSSPMPG